jgi:hypothetical protein
VGVLPSRPAPRRPVVSARIASPGGPTPVGRIVAAGAYTRNGSIARAVAPWLIEADTGGCSPGSRHSRSRRPHVEKKDLNVEVEAFSDKPLEELTVLVQDAVTAAGYQPAGMDNEGDEAEVFFQSGSLAAGQARIEESGCEGQWEIELVLLDRDAAP